MIIRSVCFIGLLSGPICTLRAQSLTPDDSLRLERLLHGEEEIKLNPSVLEEFRQNFLGTPKVSDDKPWLKFDETLPAVPDVKKKAKLTLHPYTPTTPYNWDPIHERKIDIDKPRWKENILRGIEKATAGAPTPSGISFMQIFTKEFWDRKGKKRKQQTLKALETYGDSLDLYLQSGQH